MSPEACISVKVKDERGDERTKSATCHHHYHCLHQTVEVSMSVLVLVLVMLATAWGARPCVRVPHQPQLFLSTTSLPHYSTNATPHARCTMATPFRPWHIQQYVKFDECPDIKTPTANFWPGSVDVGSQEYFFADHLGMLSI